MSDDRYRRRDVLKKTTIAASFPIASQSVSATPSTARLGEAGEVGITDQSGLSPEIVNEDIQTISKNKEVQTLASQIEDETGFKLDKASAVGIDIKTDDKELNALDPRIIHFSMKPPRVGNISTTELTRNTQYPPQSEFSIDNGGTLIGLTVHANSERTIAALMGITREKSQSYSLLEGTTEQVDTKSFVVEDGSAKVHRKRANRQPFKSSWQARLGLDIEPVIMDTGFTCWGCATVVGIACAGAATLSYSSCVSAAFASSVFSPWAFAAVGAFCTYIVSNAGTLSCAAGTAAICASVTDDCDFLE